MDEFLNFSINNVDIGKGVYDHYVRNSGIGSTNEFKNEFYVILSKSLLLYYQVDKYFKKYNINVSVQTEVQFLPGFILFQCALINGAKVYARAGMNGITVKKFTNINEKYYIKERFSTKLYDLINKNIRKEAIEIGDEIIKKRFEGLVEYQIQNNDLYFLHPQIAPEQKN